MHLSTDAQALEQSKAERNRLETAALAVLPDDSPADLAYRVSPENVRATWSAHRRVSVTFSLPTQAETDRAAAAVTARLERAGVGFTLAAATGGWQGAREPACTVTVVGDGIQTVARIAAAAAIGAGCSAVQAEYWTGADYRCEELRA